jgi:hypothetical protein
MNSIFHASGRNLWEQFLKTAGGPPAFITDSETQAEGRCVSDNPEKAGGLADRGRENSFPKVAFLLWG